MFEATRRPIRTHLDWVAKAFAHRILLEVVAGKGPGPQVVAVQDVQDIGGSQVESRGNQEGKKKMFVFWAELELGGIGLN
jgi:hypothetical protein